MITHAISTSALFIIVGLLSDRLHTRNLDEMGGLWEQVPKMGGIAMVFVMASLGLPGLGNFIAEFLVLAGSFQASVLWSVLGSLGLIASAIYALRIMQKVWHERKAKEWKIKDYIPRELIILGSLILVIVWLGLFPQKIFSTISSSINSIHDRINDAKILLINNSIKTEIITNSSVNNEINTNQQKDDK